MHAQALRSSTFAFFSLFAVLGSCTPKASPPFTEHEGATEDDAVAPTAPTVAARPAARAELNEPPAPTAPASAAPTPAYEALMGDSTGPRIDGRGLGGGTSTGDGKAAKPGKDARKTKNGFGVGEGSIGLGNIGTIGRGYGGGGMGLGALSKRSSAMQLSASPAAMIAPDFDREAYAHLDESGFAKVDDSPLSTFSIDVDTASYSNVRRMLRDGQLPPAGAVRIEEMINYFDYADAPPSDGQPIALHAEVTEAPWAPEHRLVRLALRARELEQDGDAPRNLVFLVDVSGSMQSEDKLPLLKRGLSLLARDLRPQDSIAIAVYAGSSGLALPATSGKHVDKILSSLERLEAGGSTNGADGIELAYRVAQQHFVAGGVNRVILATDGDFNVGVTSQDELVRLIEEKRKGGVFLTVLGFGTGNLQDSTMEALADKGNGNYAYIDSIAEAHKVLVREAGGTLVTVAKDVKIQVEWNPVHVESYRLIGYENRKLADRDFADDRKDAGEMGAGHRVTALYDVTLRERAEPSSEVGPLRYQGERDLKAAADSDELLTFKVRYKLPEGSTSELIARTVRTAAEPLDSASADMRLSAAVAGFGMLLRSSEHKGATTLGMVRKLAKSATKVTARERMELLDLIDAAGRLGLGG